MSKISDLIFAGEKHYITSPFGRRAGGYHYGTDYGTEHKKIPQFAIEDGYVLAAGISKSEKAIYAWVIYPRTKKAFLHWHLDSVSVTAGQKVSKGTRIGYTGQTGYATGIHLHLGVRDLSQLSENQINSLKLSVLLDNAKCPYIDPESYGAQYTEPEALKDTTEIAKEVLSGLWGNGGDRKNRLTAAGYDYDLVQAEVNRLLNTNSAPKKSINQIAQEVIDGKWGNGLARKAALTAAGYSYREVQNEVNRLLK